MKNTKKGDAMMITLIVIAVVAVGIIGYMMYSNNQSQQEADAKLSAQKAQTQAAQQEAQYAQAQIQAQAQAQEKALTDATDSAQAQIEAAAQKVVVDANATCEENLASAQKNLPNLKDYAELLEKGGEIIEENPDEAIEQCRITHEDLSKGECETKVNNFVSGKEDLFKEIQAEITVSKELITAGC